jgi:hypothetical protein
MRLAVTNALAAAFITAVKGFMVEALAVEKVILWPKSWRGRGEC